ncbi:MAG: hypothetical protein PHX50_09995 [Massilibacteroides sp.]|nr:hypothetical protein [Massilibacteroides sp.]MDD3063147.1 hypothetical protein [Massilibacteroides sp.]MDD4661523.1 hypothetical protein [Massilibacteroides sp.]
MKFLFQKQNVIREAVLLLLLSFISFNPIFSQIVENIFQENKSIDPDRKGNLSVEIDNLTFFKNNEYEGEIMKGYTLPGFWLNGKVVYYPLENIKLEAGAHTLYYYGTKRYPSYAYLDIAEWNPDSYQHGIRILPFFRAHVALSSNVDLILGNIYGGSNHQLIEPLYNSELNLTADPEMGAQFLYHSPVFDADVWVNWESFIFRNDTHQEAFTFGFSTRIKYNNSQSRFHFYSPVQALAQHRGGEIDTIQTNSVHTLMNAAIGIGMEWNPGSRLFRKMSAEINGMTYYQQAGKHWPLDDGNAVHVALSALITDFRVKAGYWKGRDFISLFGIPYYGAVSTVDQTRVYQNPSTVYLGFEYTRTFAEHYALGIDVDFYKPQADGLGSKSSFSAGIYLRVNPSFLLKKYYP